MTTKYKSVLISFVAAAVCANLSFAGEREQPDGGGAFPQAQFQAETAASVDSLKQGKFHGLVTDDVALEAWLAVGKVKKIDLGQMPLPELARRTVKIFKNQFDLILPPDEPDLTRMAVQIRLQNAHPIEVFSAMNLYFQVQKLPARWILTLNGRRLTAILYLDSLPGGAARVEKTADTVFPIPDILREGNPAVHLLAAEHLEDSLTEALNDVRKPGRAKANSPGGPVVKAHTQSGIVVLNGTWDETELVRSTLQALKDSAQERQDVAKDKILRAKNEAARAESEDLKNNRTEK